MKKLISTLLSVCLLIGALSGLFTVNLVAAESNDDIDLSAIDYLTEVYYTAENKLATMTNRFEKGDYQIWVNDYTGEVALVNTATGETLFSNPYDVGLSKAAASVKAELLSQIIIGYTGNSLTGTNIFTSYTDAALNNQIKVKSIKNGIRVEYTIGREETKYLVPRLITKERFETMLLAPITEQITAEVMAEGEEKGWSESTIETQTDFRIKKFYNMFELHDPTTMESDRMKADLYSKYPVAAKLGALYAIDSAIKPAELIKLEETIKNYCPEYTYEELDNDHSQTEYVSQDQNPAVFKLALEYTLDDLGLSVTLPANGIRFDESIYQLSYITVLPYMGAGEYSEALPNTGYTFLPDGSGTIFRFEDLATSGGTIGGKIYGQDYAYHTISGKYQETFRMPVYGVVRDNVYTYEATSTGAYTVVKNENPTSSGFFAIIEEGDALAEMKSYHLGQKGEYHSVQLTVNPRPSDTYFVSGGGSWTVVSDRKYVDNYKIRYFLLTDDQIADEIGVTNTYSADYFGMAEAYRDYLMSPYSTGTQNEAVENQISVLTRMTADQVESSIPLYLETFGAMETVEKILSIPVNVMTPLTTFEDIKQIYADLSQESVGITNINFKLTGYANGGLYSTIPYNLKWEKSVGGKDGFLDLIQYANSINAASETDGKNLGIFPDFDFAYVSNFDSFDGFTLRDHAVKTIDDRYTSKRTYSATFQTYEDTSGLAVSPAYFSRFYNKLATKYLQFSEYGDGSDLNISVATLGTELNSDFDEDEPYNREDSKQFTIAAFKDLSNMYGNVMTNGGNAYTWQYVDYILGLPIDSSRYLASSTTIPFTGIVLHGSLEYTGNPINMEGNIQYGLLRAIESGASLYFILTYDNATELKEDYNYSKYYSVRYDIWAGSYNEDGEFEAGELVEIYHSLNDVVSDLQTKLIINHELLKGMRIPDAEELEADQRAQEEADRIAAEQDAIAAANKLRAELLEARISAVATAENALTTATGRLPRENNFATTLKNVTAQVEKLKNSQEQLASMTNGEDTTAVEASIEAAIKEINRLYTNYMNAYNAIKTSYKTIQDKVRIVETAVEYFKTSGIYSQAFIDDNAVLVDQIKTVSEKMDEVMASADAYRASFAEASGGVIVIEPETDGSVSEEENKISERYLLDDGSIVAVTYGEEGEPYRTFLLNYNYFTISVDYQGNTYEIDRYGFVVIDYEN